MTTTNRVLLVDDESKIVDALQRLLRPLRETWTVTTATSAKAALEILDRESFQVVVSDMRMPEMDGAALLAIVRQKFPGTARVILSGQTEKTAALRAGSGRASIFAEALSAEHADRAAHAPCRVSVARRRAASAHRCDRLAPVRSRNGAGPLSRLVDGGNVRLAEVTALVKSEPVLILKLLQLSSSSFFGTARAIVDLAAVVSGAGDDLLQTLAASARDSGSMTIASKTFDLRSFRDHARAIAASMQSAAPIGPTVAARFVAGMLHDIGKLVMATHAGDRFDAVSRRASVEGISFEQSEVAEGVESHASVGAALLDLWGLPRSIVAAVARQHQSASGGGEGDLVVAIDLAHRVVDGSAG